MLGRLPIEAKERPVINSSFISNRDFGEPRSMNLDSLIYWVKRTPECIGILKRIATDIVTEVSFTSVAEQATGRPSKSLHMDVESRAIKFWKRNNGRQKMVAAVIDFLMTGDFYMWKGRVKDVDMKEIAKRHIGNYQFLGEAKEFINELKLELFLDEDWNGINAIEVVPSSMTTIDHDEIKINKYIQRSKMNPGSPKEFSTDEIIHGKLLDIDGKVYGFSPMESSFVAIKTINAIQDYNYNYFANGVKLDRAWLFMGNPNQSYLDKHEETVKKYKSVTHAHGDIVVAGADDIKLQNLNEVGEEMEFRKLAINAVGRLAFAFNMPADILSSILGVDVKGTAMGSDIDDAGYNRNIVESQKYLEELFNTQLWVDFKVTMEFQRTFKQDQIRQIQYQTQVIPVLDFLFSHDYPVSDEYIHHLLQIDRKFLVPGKIERKPMDQIPFPPGKPLPSTPKKSPDNPSPFSPLSQAKKKQQEPQSRISPPGGS